MKTPSIYSDEFWQEAKMSKMVERVARGLCLRTLNAPTYPVGFTDRYINKHWIVFEDTARAAIEAMKEPTEAMKKAGSAYTGGNITPVRIGFAYQDMIEEALK